MSRIQNAMAIIEQELDEADLDYNIQATTIAYHNAEGVQRIYNACLTGEFQPDILVQRFLKELGLPAASRLNDHSDLSFYVAKAQSASLVAVLPAEFPIFVPTLTEKAAREDDIRKRFQGIFNKASPRNQFGLILSPSRGPFLRNALTQPDEDGIEDNIVFLDEDDMRTIITRKIEPQIAFIDFVRRSIRLTRISPFITEGPTRQLVFVGREQEIRTVEENIAEHSSAINGSRRIGKTSVLMQIEQSLRKQGCKVFFLECSAASNYSDFFHIIRDEWKDELGSFVQQIEETPLGFRDIVTILQYNELQKTPVVFILDEIDRLLQYDKQQEASYLLFRTFRDLSQRERCQFVFGGERYVFQQHSDSSSPLFNFCKYIQLGLLSREDAHKLVGPSFQLLNIRLEDEQKLIDYIADMCSYHPNLIQYVCQRILDGLEPQGKSLRPTITWELARKVVRHPKFKEEYVNVFWGQSTPLEKAITLLAPEHGSFTSQSIFEELKKYGFEITRERFTMALKYLILCNIFNDDDSDNQGLYWTADHFKEFLDLKASDQTILIEELRSQFPRDR